MLLKHLDIFITKKTKERDETRKSSSTSSPKPKPVKRSTSISTPNPSNNDNVFPGYDEENYFEDDVKSTSIGNIFIENYNP